MATLDELVAMLDGTKAEDITKTDRLKVAVCALQKTGKSYLVAHTARKPLLHYDFDDRRESIAGAKDTIIRTLVDRDSTHPTAYSKLISQIGDLEYLKNKGELPIKSICLDSMTYLRKYLGYQIMHDTNLKRTRKIDGRDVNIPQGWDEVTVARTELTTLFRRLFALDLDVYAIFHIIPQKDKAKTEKVQDVAGNIVEVTAYTGRWTVDPQHLEEILAIFNEVWRCYIDASGDFKIQVRPDEYFQAATALKNVEKIENANIAELLAKHGV